MTFKAWLTRPKEERLAHRDERRTEILATRDKKLAANSARYNARKDALDDKIEDTELRVAEEIVAKATAAFIEYTEKAERLAAEAELEPSRRKAKELRERAAKHAKWADKEQERAEKWQHNLDVLRAVVDAREGDRV